MPTVRPGRAPRHAGLRRRLPLIGLIAFALFVVAACSSTGETVPPPGLPWELADILTRQGHLYTLTTRHGDTTHSRVIGSIIGYVNAVDNTNTASERIADEVTAIVSLTVTEAGYTDTPPTTGPSTQSPPASPNGATKGTAESPS